MNVIKDILYLNDFDLNNLRLIPKLYNFISKAYDKNKPNIVRAPESIRHQKQRNFYLQGFKLYCQACNLTNINQEDLTELNLFYMAMVGRI